METLATESLLNLSWAETPHTNSYISLAGKQMGCVTPCHTGTRQPTQVCPSSSMIQPYFLLVTVRLRHGDKAHEEVTLLPSCSQHKLSKLPVLHNI